MKPFEKIRYNYAEKGGGKMGKSGNVKLFSKYGQNEGNFRSMSLIEWQKFLGVIDNFKHKLMMRLLYELGCRVGELVRIQLKHLDLINSSVFNILSSSS